MLEGFICGWAFGAISTTPAVASVAITALALAWLTMALAFAQWRSCLLGARGIVHRWRVRFAAGCSGVAEARVFWACRAALAAWLARHFTARFTRKLAVAIAVFVARWALGLACCLAFCAFTRAALFWTLGLVATGRAAVGAAFGALSFVCTGWALAVFAFAVFRFFRALATAFLAFAASAAAAVAAALRTTAMAVA